MDPLAPGRFRALALPVAALTVTLVWLAWGAARGGAWALVLIAGAVALHAAAILDAHRHSALPMRAALGLGAVALAVVALLPLHQSRDLYLYNIYGRSVVEHRVNPYEHPPATLDDETVTLVADAWHQQESLYGPAFVATAAAVARISGTSPLTIRLAWQGAMALAAVAALLLVARRTRDPVAVLALGCSPVLLAAVNDAHNDVLIGLALLGVVLLVEERQFSLAGAVASLAIAIKAPIAVPVVGIAAWIAWRGGRRHGWRSAARFLTPIVVAVTTAYLVVGGREALVPLRESAGDDSRFALWQTLRDQRFEALRALGTGRAEALTLVRDQMSLLAMLLLGACGIVLAVRYRRAARPGEVATIATVALMLTSTYVMPWYPAMVLPVAALAWRSRASILVQLQAAFLVIAYADGPGGEPRTSVGLLLEHRGLWINLALLAAVLVWVRPEKLVADVDLAAEDPSRRHADALDA